jgi:DMSO/TMAO reductase YedYZ molybdopterin-dependent catalytic subunit
MSIEKADSAEAVLVVDGAVNHSLRLSFADLAAISDADQIAEVETFHPGRKGRGVDLRGLLQMADPRPDARFLTLHAGRDDFHVSIPLAEIRDRGMIVYRQGDSPLRLENGGPFRFLIRDPASCHSAELDDCANVKYLSRIELTAEKGLDTRPGDDESHAALHAQQEGNPGASGIQE